MVQEKSSFTKNDRRGIAVVEFLFAAPAFFILSFFVVEIALIWSDRHIMRLAAYRAARTVIKMRAESPGPQLCWGADPRADSKSFALFKSARRSSSKIMSTVTPSITQLLTMFGNPIDGKKMEEILGSNVDKAFGGADSSDGSLNRIANNPYVHAIYRMLKGLPSAWVFTELECTDIKYPAADGVKGNNGVEIKLTYHRSAKMPYVGTIIWLLRHIQAYYTDRGWGFDGVSEMIRINPLNYGIEFKVALESREYEMAKEQLISDLREKVVERAKKTSNSIGKKIEDAFPGALGGLSSDWSSGDDVADRVGSIFDEYVGPRINQHLDEYMSQAQETINSIGEKALQIFLRAPDELKTIPVSVAVRIPNYSQAFVNEGHPWDGRAVLVGRFANGGNMSSMARAIGETLDRSNPPNGEQGGLPYVKNHGGSRENE